MSKFFLSGKGQDPNAIPKDSWWTQGDFYAAARARAPRMRNSEFGRWNLSLDTAPGWVEHRADGIKGRRGRHKPTESQVE